MNLYDYLFELPDYVVFVICVVGVGLLSFIAALTMKFLAWVFPNKKGTTLISTMLSGILLPTGMVIAFVASDVWQADERGRVAVEQEATAIFDALRVTKHLAPADAQPLKALIQNYTKTVVGEEWPMMGRGEASDKAEGYLEDLMLTAVEMQAGDGTRSRRIAGEELRRYATRIELARDTRLTIAQSSVRIPKWIAVFVMLFVAACVMAELHISFRRSLIISLSLFSLAFGVTIFLIAAYDRPFTGITVVPPTPIENAMARVYPPGGVRGASVPESSILQK